MQFQEAFGHRGGWEEGVWGFKKNYTKLTVGELVDGFEGLSRALKRLLA